ncbi:Tetratricopeptide repeat-containing protein [Sunxiuqinia elliptica]|uniref:Tetratricopeptide repeat-containing protein n=2 Tax=Sunxiuqinia elliptica TaxID=655355 RepID=A0A1I2CD55_9BACT|nr:Tetratricopeptide repeat-containing protein [Sunxiuqinia elliptica]
MNKYRINTKSNIFNTVDMRKFSFKPLAFFALAATLLAGCSGLQKMKKNADQIDFNVTPEILEAHGGDVDVAINGRFPAKYFNKKATVVATPVLTYEGGETAFEPVTLQGEKVDANNKVISYTSGGNFAYKDAVGYQDDMRVSDLEIRITASKGAKSLDFEPIKVADGVLATSEMVINYPAPILGVQREKNTTGVYDPNIDEFQRIVPDQYVADIHYLINSSYVRGTELRNEDLKELYAYTKDAFEAERKELKNVEVSAYASPDGELDWNTKLSQQRESSSNKVVARELKKSDVEAELRTKFTPEDWDGFKEMMEKSNIQDKELILRVLSMYSDPEVREREIRNLSQAFTVVADEILPKLRRAKIAANVDLIGKTDEEIAALADSDPASLNPAELLYAATLTTDKNKKLAIYNSFIKVYPKDWRGYNNAGMVLAQQGKFADAKPLFEKAEGLASNEPIIKNNLGAVALREGDIAKAESLFGAASGAGDEVNYNLGIVALKKGEYDKAVKLFGDSDSPNVGLAKILSGDNNGALKSLDNCTWEGCYMKEYFKAVVGARTAKENLMYESLENAVKMKPELKEKAATDMEFAKYWDAPKFQAIVK